jgi:hypothetical protein
MSSKFQIIKTGEILVSAYSIAPYVVCSYLGDIK